MHRTHKMARYAGRKAIMPNCFQLTSRTTGKAVPFNEVDAKLCEHFAVKCDAANWFHWWYPSIMEWGVACGRDFAKQRVDTLRELHAKRMKRKEMTDRQEKLSVKNVQRLTEELSSELSHLDHEINNLDEEIRGQQTTLEIIDWLDVSYAAEAWYQSK